MSVNLGQVFKDIEKQMNGHVSQGIDLRKHRRELTQAANDNLNRWIPREKRNEKAPLFQVIDFFSGAGGMSLGFSALSADYPFFEVVGGIDIDSDACESFELNFNAPGIRIDIRELHDNARTFENVLGNLPRYDPGRPTVAIGCPPCQGFTSHRKKKWDEDDERNTLVEIFAEIAVGLDPVCVVIENVPEMLSEKYWHHFDKTKRTLVEKGYCVRQTIVNAASFGVPQERFRAIILAFKEEFAMPEPLLIDRRDYVTVREAIGHLKPVSAGQQLDSDPLHRSANHRESTIETIKAVPVNGGNRPSGVGPKCLDRIKGFSDVYGRLYWDRPAITLTRYARNPASGRYVHPEQNRGLTMREAALLQSFPNGFEFVGTLDSVFRQIGESVPPKLATGVAATVLVELVSPPPEEEAADQELESISRPVSNSYSSVIAGIKNSRKSDNAVHVR